MATKEMEMHEPGTKKVIKDTNKAYKNFLLRYLQSNEEMSMLVMYLTPDENNKYEVK